MVASVELESSSACETDRGETNKRRALPNPWKAVGHCFRRQSLANARRTAVSLIRSLGKCIFWLCGIAGHMEIYNVTDVIATLGRSDCITQVSRWVYSRNEHFTLQCTENCKIGLADLNSRCTTFRAPNTKNLIYASYYVVIDISAVTLRTNHLAVDGGE